MNNPEEAVIALNESFYVAFNEANLELMHEIWSEQHPVSVIHPGCNLIFNYDEVMKSWAHIFSADKMPEIKQQTMLVNFVDRMAFVICSEDLGEGILIATNIFVYEDPDWKMIHHQAGPLNQQIASSHDEVLH